MASRSKDRVTRQIIYQRRRKHLPVVFAILGALILFNLIGTVSLRLEPFELSISTRLGIPGNTTLSIPPLGTIRATTHLQPVKITVSLQNVDLEGLKNLVSTGETNAQTLLISHFGSKFGSSIMLLLIKYMLIAGAGGILGVLVLGKRRWQTILMGFIIGSLLIGLLIGTIYFSFDPQGFQKPHYEGLIEAAPWMINLIEESIVKVDELGEVIQSLAKNLYVVFNQIENLKGIGILSADIMVLHVSDIHNHPVAYDFIRQVIENFPIDLVIDTGDLTDLGSPLEAEIVTQIESLAIPYIFISGNHDTPEVITRLAETKNVILIDSDFKQLDILGLSIVGIPDPSAHSFSAKIAPYEELVALADRINERYRDKKQKPPNIFCVHNHRIALLIEPSLLPVVLYGHNHMQAFSQIEGTAYIDAGTTGAAGIRGLQSKEPVPFSLSMLYFSQTAGGDYLLTAVDSIQIQGLEASFSLQRSFISPWGRNQAENVEETKQIFE